MTPLAELGPIVPAILEALEHSGTAVEVLTDRGGGRFDRLYASKGVPAMLGLTTEEHATRNVLDTIAPEQRSLVIQLALSFRAGQPVPPALEFKLVHKDGSLLPVEISMGFHRLDEGAIYVLLIRPIGSQQQSQVSLLEADRIGLVGALAAGFAHEINNPLTSMLLNLRSLRKQLSAAGVTAPPQALRCIEDIATGAERIASNVRALQTLATRSTTQPIDLAAVVSSALRLAAPTLEPRAHVIRQIFPVRPVIGEESRIGQAVLAMMLFSSSGFDTEVPSTHNRIVVSVEERGTDVVLEVSDNGRDLTTEEVRSAFNPFFRSSARGAGVGVGLGVARSVAAALGGDVTLAPRAGGGAVITLRIPIDGQP